MKPKRLNLYLLALCALSHLWLVPSASAQIRALDTPHYRIHSDLDWRLTEDLGAGMEAMYRDYPPRLASFDPPDGKRFEVSLFLNRRDFVNLTNDAMPNV